MYAKGNFFGFEAYTLSVYNAGYTVYYSLGISNRIKGTTDPAVEVSSDSCCTVGEGEVRIGSIPNNHDPLVRVNSQAETGSSTSGGQ